MSDAPGSSGPLPATPSQATASPALPSPAPGSFAAFLRLARVKFLFQSMMVTGFGVTLAVHATGAFSLAWYLLTLAFAWSTHLMTHFCNEYFDLEADRANPRPTAWTGGSRVLVDGLLTPATSIGAAFVLLFTSLALVLAMPTLPARLLAGALTALAWFYTAPPLRLNYHALGEASCAAVLYGMGPLLAAVLQPGGAGALLGWCTGLVAALQVLRCLVMNLADIEGDALVGKATLAGLLGARRVTHVYTAGQAVLYAGVLVLALTQVLPAVVAAAQLLVAPVAVLVVRGLRTDAMSDTGRSGDVTFWASMQLPLTTCATMLALLADLLLAGKPAPALWNAVAGGTALLFTVWLYRAVAAARRPAHHEDTGGTATAPPETHASTKPSPWPAEPVREGREAR
ncbi:prenyltransferase [Streptomyces diacarni]|uniref:prenyltransferase n=1 Tax=Streptomyces diacarni TaxID=2800381 RepID=UPI0033FBDB3F